MFAVKKIIEGQKVTILSDINTNGRLLINDRCIVVYDEADNQHLRRLLSHGWSKCDKNNDSESIITKGNFVGSVHLVEYLNDVELDSNKYYLDLNFSLNSVEHQISYFIKTSVWIQMRDYYTKNRKGETVYYKKPPWIE